MLWSWHKSSCVRDGSSINYCISHDMLYHDPNRDRDRAKRENPLSSIHRTVTDWLILRKD